MPDITTTTETTNTQYPDLLETMFPLGVDNWDRYAALNLDALALMKQYYGFLETDNVAAANEVLEKNPILNRYAVTEKSMNQLRDAIIAIERFYFSDVQQYLVNIIKWKGEFSNTVKYSKFNVVSYPVKGAYEAFLCIADAPLGSYPTDLNYWVPVALRGEKGESGTGLSPRGIWNNITIYYQDDLVSFNNKLWAAVRDNTGVQPILSSSDTWIVIMEFDTSMFTVVDDAKENRYRLGSKGSYLYYQNETDASDDGKMFLAKKSDLDNKIKILKSVTLNRSAWDSTTLQAKHLDASILSSYIPVVNFNKASRIAARKADICVESYNGFLLFTAAKKPATGLVIESIVLTQS